MKKRIFYIYIVFLCVFGINLHAQSDANAIFENYIITEGYATISVPVEYISIQLYVHSLKKTPRLAQETNQKIIDDLFTMLIKEYTIKKKDLYAKNTRLHPQYEYNKQTIGGGERKILVGYKASTQIIINLYLYQRFSELMLSVLDTSVEEISAINYMPSSDSKYYKKALTLALADARSKAELLAQESNVKLDYQSIQITENPSVPSYPSAPKALSSARESHNMGIAENQDIHARLSLKIGVIE